MVSYGGVAARASHIDTGPNVDDYRRARRALTLETPEAADAGLPVAVGSPQPLPAAAVGHAQVRPRRGRMLTSRWRMCMPRGIMCAVTRAVSFAPHVGVLSGAYRAATSKTKMTRRCSTAPKAQRSNGKRAPISASSHTPLHALLRPMLYFACCNAHAPWARCSSLVQTKPSLLRSSTGLHASAHCPVQLYRH